MAARDIYQLPTNSAPTAVVELADGRRYRKQLVKFGSYVDPGDRSKKMVLDKPWAEKLVENFKNKVLNKVPIVAGHPKDVPDSESLLAKTRGWVESMSIQDDGLYGELEIKKTDTAADIDQNLIDDVSVSFDSDYLDKASGAHVGPALMHVGLVNDPYIKGMQPFQALSDSPNVIMLSESKENAMSVKIKNDREFPVTINFKVGDENKSEVIEAGSEVEVPEDVATAVQEQITAATKPEPTAEEIAAADKVAADQAAADEAKAKEEADAKAKAEADKDLSELDKAKRDLSEAQTKLRTQEAEKTYDALLHEGKIVPAQKDAFIALSSVPAETVVTLSDGKSSPINVLLSDLFQAAPKRIMFGENGAGEGEKTPWDALTEEERAASTKLGVSEETYNTVNGPKK